MLENISTHYIPILISSVVCFALGAFWYSPALFGNQWMSSIAKNKNLSTVHLTVKQYGYIFFAVAFFNLAMSIVIDATNSVGMMDGIATGILIWAGFCATSSIIIFLIEKQPIVSYGIAVGYLFVIAVISGSLLAMWK